VTIKIVNIPKDESIALAKKLGVWIGNTIYKIKITNNKISNWENDLKTFGIFIYTITLYFFNTVETMTYKIETS
jgi:hypothetical protein